MLEPQVSAHADAMFLVLSDLRIYEHENAPPPTVEWLRDRFARLESRASPDGREAWLNWVIRLPSGELAGYVQATVAGRQASIAYVLGSRWWGRGIATEAVRTMMTELRATDGVETFVAVFKRGNLRSRRLLARLGFVDGAACEIAADEAAMHWRP